METPECHWGFTYEQLRRIIPENQWDHYLNVSRGSTGVICEGQRCEDAHGFVTYTHDIEKFFRLLEKGL